MDAFVDAYYKIDKDGSDFITKDELEQYAKENNYDSAFVQKWLRLFDRNNTGRITLAEFCDKLGLEVKKVKSQRVITTTSQLPDDIHVISSDMNIKHQLMIVNSMRKGFAEFENEKEVARTIKQTMDSEHEPLWHVVIVLGQFWCWYSHEPNYSFIYRFGRHIFLVWKTPDA